MMMIIIISLDCVCICEVSTHPVPPAQQQQQEQQQPASPRDNATGLPSILENTHAAFPVVQTQPGEEPLPRGSS